MHSAYAVARSNVDVQSELSYWHQLHTDGRLGGYDFCDYAKLLKLGYSVYQAYPHASPAQRYQVLQDSYYLCRPALVVPWKEARWLVRQSWQHMQHAPGALSTWAIH